MILELYLTPRSKRDLAEIYQYTFEEWGLVQADRYQDELFHGMQLILENIHLGKKYEYHDRSYRKLHINRHLIFYRVKGNRCIVIRILHDQMSV